MERLAALGLSAPNRVRASLNATGSAAFGFDSVHGDGDSSTGRLGLNIQRNFESLSGDLLFTADAGSCVSNSTLAILERDRNGNVLRFNDAAGRT